MNGFGSFSQGCGIFPLILFMYMGLQAQTVLKPVDEASSVRFVIRNFGLSVEGSVSGLGGEALFDVHTTANSRFDLSARSSTIRTGNRLRDNHLQKEQYFHSERFPEIRFRSTKVERTSAGNYRVTGVMKLKGVSREVSIPFNAQGSDGGYILSGSYRLNRIDFGVGSKSVSISDSLTISFRIKVS